MHFAPGVEMMLLKRHFDVVTVAVGVVSVPSNGSTLPQTVIRVRCVSDLLGRGLQTIRGKATLFVAKGTSVFGMK